MPRVSKFQMGQKMSRKFPLLVILGSTGTGKTKLSLELASKFGGEIVGADSMQVYKELDIASAKATRQELASVPHHMINILSPRDEFTVLNYRNRVLPILDDIIRRGKLPIIVGGTNYYIESILWRVLVQEPEESHFEARGNILTDKDYELPSQLLHQKLKELDPRMANRLHPNNKRKIIRALEVLHQKGKKLSDIIDEQCATSKSGGGLRFDNSLVLWLQCNQETLDQRLNDRVDKMMKEGLLEELQHFHKLFNESRITDSKDLDYTKGIFQSIGFKEFHPYLMLSIEERTSENGQEILKQSIENLKIATRRYARKQIKWTSNRFLSRKDRQVPPIYGLDTTDVSQWTENVTRPAFEIVESYISNTECKMQPLPMMNDRNSTPNILDETLKCEVCERVFVGHLQWDIHLKSHRHRKVLEKLKRQKKLEESSGVSDGKVVTSACD